MFNKSGQETGRNAVLVLVLSLAILTVMAGVLYVVFVEREDVFTRKICQISVYFSDQTLGIFQKLGVGGVFCNTYYKEFENLDEDEFLEKIAENMRQCFWMWGEGKRDPAGKNLIKWSDNQCFNCYVIEPLGDVPEIIARDLEDYLQREYIGSTDTTYWNYFKGFNNNRIIFNFPISSISDPLFRERKLYAVTFVENTEPSVIARTIEGSVAVIGVCLITGPGALLCGSAALLGGTALGTGTWLMDYFAENPDGIMISEFDENENVCSGEIG
ncbi:hypothetical protein J4443_03520 [Candidatus Woesearchaeota archaeon]|nr:hypothetical protein [Candidatus Woesearchaeota archaeon]